MCGIAGKLSFGAAPGESDLRRLLDAMNACLAHRGPDAAGAWMTPERRVGLAHRRLSIVDLDPRSHQPMRSPHDDVVVTFNGEIYNFKSLRDSAGPHVEWKTASDTEVLLWSYRACDGDIPAFLDGLRGMFALAIWDSTRQQLVIARDPVGKKPVYYARTSSGLTFGSTVAAVLQDPAISREPDGEALRLYLRLGYVPAPYSAFKAIAKLEAGHYLVARAGGQVELQQYWAPTFGPKTTAPEADVVEDIRGALARATRARMLADVPVGAFLSGGIDSAAVVAMMSRAATTPVKTFSVGFAGFAGDEAPYARLVADHFGCDHHALSVALEPASLPEIVTHFEEPFADAAAIPTFFMAKAAREHVTVVLNGDGGDEDFAGYTLRHRTFQRVEQLASSPAVRQLCLSLSRLMPGERASESSLTYRARKALRVAGQSGWHRNIALMEMFPAGSAVLPGDAQDLDSQGVLEAHWAQASKLEGLDRELYFSFALHLPEQLLVKVDRMSMAWALEARSPLLDRDFVELCNRIPASMKLTPNEDKHIFRAALRGIVPDAILSRPKQGFIPPLGQWLRCELRPLVEATLLADDGFVTRTLNGSEARRLIRDHLDGRRDHQRQVYALLSLELWERQFVRRQTF